jgi:phosphate butyryltransferase
LATEILDSAGTIRSFVEMRRRAQEGGPKRLAVVMADDDVVLTAVADAFKLGLAYPVLIGNEEKIRAKATALGLEELLRAAEIVPTEEAAMAGARMAGEGAVDILLKGHLRTDELLRAALDKSAGVRTGRLLSDVDLYEDTLSGGRRLVGITDGGLNVAPNLEQKEQIVLNAIEVLHCLGFKRPKIALLSATEVVSDALPSTVEAAALTEMGAAGAFGDAEVFGPLALDNALLPWAAEAKGIHHEVAGHADCMVAPTIEAANLLGKAAVYMAGSHCAHVVAGAKVPILIPSRVESAEDKLNSIALGVLYANR